MSDSFPPDFAIEYDGQIYRPIGVLPHITRDGRQIRMIEWVTNCPRCGVEFTIATTTLARNWRRRCDACKAPGRKVKADRKQFRRQIRHEGAWPDA
jgi:hypothetical protein